jgi:hypothetical protein
MLRAVIHPGNRGPERGQFSLQAALRKEAWSWFKIGGPLLPGEIPWIWSFLDAPIAVQFNQWGWPFIIGPNVFFGRSSNPGKGRFEAEVLDAEYCKLQFTESEWYAALIQQHCNHNEAPIILWSYPIEPQPLGPLPAEYDLLIYLKDMTLGREVLKLQNRWPKSNLVVYGKYNRGEMIDLARKSRAAAYISSDDRGPLAAAEIAITGCPLVGIERGCPWVTTPGLGVQIPHFGEPGLLDACDQAMSMDRESVRGVATERFATSRTIKIIKDALEPIALGS